MKTSLARRMSRIKPSAIREILKVTERPEITSFAGGLPAPEAFPVEEIARAHADVLRKDGAAALQYGLTEGFIPLRGWIAARLQTRGQAATADGVLVTAGSQQGIDLVARALIDPGDVVVVENPSYLAALQVFQSYEAKLMVVGSDDHGLDVDDLERLLSQVKPKLIYTVPTFQNPRGVTMSLERRQKLVKLAAEHKVAVLEDDPYSELRYSGTTLPSLAALDKHSRVISLGSFSKTLAPGLRLGWAAGQEALLRAMVVCKQSADLHTGVLAQRAVMRLLESFDFEAHLARLRALYGARRDAMLEAAAQHFPPGTRWTHPEGGLFVWAEFPEGIDAEELLQDAMAQKVAFVPGTPFFAERPRRGTARLNFSFVAPEQIRDGIARLGACAAKRVEALHAHPRGKNGAAHAHR